jgi:CheY-like chemotaxis protein
VNLPQLLLVDDSAAIVAFEAAALSGLYALATASDGGEALAKIREIKPALVLLDLSMPVMDGDEVLAKVRADRALDDVAIIIVSTERSRAEACLKVGAQGYLPKPLKADELRATVARVLDDVTAKLHASSLAVLFVRVGKADLGLSLQHIEAVTLMPATRLLASGPEFLRRMMNFRGRPLGILDLARRLGIPWERSIEERKLVVIAVGGELSIAISVDDVREPLLVQRSDVVERRAFGGGEHDPLHKTLEAIVKTPEGPVPVLDPAALLSPESLDVLRAAIDEVRAMAPSGSLAPPATASPVP